MKSPVLVCILLLALVPPALAQEDLTMKDARGKIHRIERSPVTGSVRWIHDPDLNIGMFGLEVRELNERIQPQLLKDVITVFGEILEIDSDEVRLRTAETDGTAWFVSFAQVVDDIPIVGTEVGYTIDAMGNIAALGATAYRKVTVSTSPLISRDAAMGVARGVFDVDSVEVRNEGVLRILPIQKDETTEFRLAWKFRFFSLSPLKDITYFIDAVNGAILRDWSNMRHGHRLEGSMYTAVRPPMTNAWPRSVPAQPGLLGGTLSGTITGYYYPEFSTDTPVASGFETTNYKISNLIGQLVAWGDTDGSGSWSTSYLASGYYTIRLPLQNEWVELHAGISGPIEHAPNIWVGNNTVYNHTWTADDAPNVHYHAAETHDFFKAAPFYFSGMDYQMNAYVDQVSTKAQANGTEIFFGHYGGQDWARSSDVIYHEYTHNVIYDVYGNDFIATVNCVSNTHESCAMDEGLADYFAGSKNSDPEIGEDVSLTRDLDNSFSWNSSENNHWNGQVIGGAAWDVAQAVGSSTGDRLTFKALQITPSRVQLLRLPYQHDFRGQSLLRRVARLRYSGSFPCSRNRQRMPTDSRSTDQPGCYRDVGSKSVS